MRINRQVTAHGFTITELMIATAVFSVVLLTALAGFLAIGRFFYKGVSVTQTGTVTHQIFADITGNFQTAANISGVQNANGYSYYCVGNTRYTYKIGQLVNLSAAPDHSSGGNFGILKDTLPGSNGCATPCDDTHSVSCPAGSVKFTNPTEMLGDTMRVESFVVQSNSAVSPNFYNVSIIIAYGADDVLGYANSLDPTTVYCQGNSATQQFCAISKLNTGVYRGTL